MIITPPPHQEPRDRETATSGRLDGTSSSGPRITLLLVEDDESVRHTIGLLLRNLGHRVLDAATDDQAVWLWERHRHEIDLLITDLIIPTRSTGTELARRFRGEKPGLAVIVTSGFGPEIGEDDPGFPAGAPFLQKPFTRAALEQTLAAVLGT